MSSLNAWQHLRHRGVHAAAFAVRRQLTACAATTKNFQSSNGPQRTSAAAVAAAATMGDVGSVPKQTHFLSSASSRSSVSPSVASLLAVRPHRSLSSNAAKPAAAAAAAFGSGAPSSVATATDVDPVTGRRFLFVLGQTYHGFTLEGIVPSADFNLVVYSFKHHATGATYWHVDRDDPDNAFCVAFRTLPSGDECFPCARAFRRRRRCILPLTNRRRAPFPFRLSLPCSSRFRLFLLCRTRLLPACDSRRLLLFSSLTGCFCPARLMLLRGVTCRGVLLLLAFCCWCVFPDSTGVAHILEHTALCGSVQFPVRDPFFLLLRRSLKTYMNAMTGSDATYYPFSTQNAQDFRNLLSVYLDAAFFPLLEEPDFRQEGHRLELADPRDVANSSLVYKGVVYNEMKGAMSDVGTLFAQHLQSALFATTTYHHNSGGDPLVIPALTYEQLLDFHATHYHPTNACFLSYGNNAPPLEAVEQRVLKHFFAKKQQEQEQTGGAGAPAGAKEHLFGGGRRRVGAAGVGSVPDVSKRVRKEVRFDAPRAVRVTGPMVKNETYRASAMPRCQISSFS
jgi:hypothetical protein